MQDNETVLIPQTPRVDDPIECLAEVRVVPVRNGGELGLELTVVDEAYRLPNDPGTLNLTRGAWSVVFEIDDVHNTGAIFAECPLMIGPDEPVEPGETDITFQIHLDGPQRVLLEFEFTNEEQRFYSYSLQAWQAATAIRIDPKVINRGVGLDRPRSPAPQKNASIGGLLFALLLWARALKRRFFPDRAKPKSAPPEEGAAGLS